LPSQGPPIDKAFRANYERLKAERLAREAAADALAPSAREAARYALRRSKLTGALCSSPAD
jgi:hypothetical protein